MKRLLILAMLASTTAHADLILPDSYGWPQPRRRRPDAKPVPKETPPAPEDPKPPEPTREKKETAALALMFTILMGMAVRNSARKELPQ